MKAKSVVPLLLALALATAGCQKKGSTRTIGLHAELSADGKGIEILKDQEHHESATVRPGDRIRWICKDCPSGATFVVTDLEFVADLDDLVNALVDAGVTDAQGFARLREELKSLRRSPTPPGEGTQPVTERHEAVESDKWEQRALFTDWSSKWVPAGEEILSPPVARRRRAGVWKFTWRIRLDGVEASWDPHIIGLEADP